jgi:hypothetical protein
MKLNDKLLLIKRPPHLFGIKNENEVKSITIEIVEKRDDAKGEFSGKTVTGYIAKGSDGYLYGYNYPEIHEGFGGGLWVRYTSNEEFLELSTEEQERFIEDYLWHDVTKFQFPAQATFAVNEDFIDYCEKHQRHFYTRKGCFYCHFMPDKQPETIMNMKEHKWKSWYQE